MSGMEDGDEEDRARLDRALAQLSDHYDSVQIVATRHNGDHTIRLDRGTGNWYSRYGAVVEWVEFQRAGTMASQLRSAGEQDD